MRRSSASSVSIRRSALSSIPTPTPLAGAPAKSTPIRRCVRYRSPGFPSPSRTTSASPATRPRPAPACWRLSGRRARQRPSSAWRAAALSSSARRTSTSSPWDRPTRTRRLLQRPIRGTGRAYREAAAAAPPRRSPPAWWPAPWAPIPVARYASPRRCAAPSGSSPPTGACRVPGWLPLRRRSTRSGRSRAASRMRRCCFR